MGRTIRTRRQGSPTGRWISSQTKFLPTVRPQVEHRTVAVYIHRRPRHATASDDVPAADDLGRHAIDAGHKNTVIAEALRRDVV